MILNGLLTDPNNGIKTAEVAERAHVYGGNTYSERPPKTFCDLIMEALDDFTM